LRLTSV